MVQDLRLLQCVSKIDIKGSIVCVQCRPVEIPPRQVVGKRPIVIEELYQHLPCNAFRIPKMSVVEVRTV